MSDILHMFALCSELPSYISTMTNVLLCPAAAGPGSIIDKKVNKGRLTAGNKASGPRRIDYREGRWTCLARLARLCRLTCHARLARLCRGTCHARLTGLCRWTCHARLARL